MSETILHFPGSTVVINESRLLERIDELSDIDDSAEFFIHGKRFRMTWLDARGWQQNAMQERRTLAESIAGVLEEYDRRHA